ncbi:inverse autotransporter beta-barrel domain-containing protein [Yersinia massiliensis]|nr:inverse autotransporter beta-barrel domain-containing protein [Yersinia massiliensis]MDA5548902.1 inverse autotransporter beta-barrel domain-containing protein [Yersinia massiliensis]PHZ22772.1 inverse autotransporter beta-barrel domain-containing protein [Yersinia massiliensis]UZM79815.1 inverse autotransporter beta-barrel domain-containing protein [Yersinia massiliensis]CQJ00162.1 invasin [Yersinia frederiksenii]
MNGFYSYKSFMRVVAFNTLLVQLMLPIVIAFSPLISSSVRANELDEQMAKMRSLDILTIPDNTEPKSGEPSHNPLSNNPFYAPSLPSTAPLSTPSSPLTAPDATAEDIKQLPDLGSLQTDINAQSHLPAVNEENVASAATQLWGIMGNENSSRAAESAVSGVASGLASQAAADWLGQYGNARVQINSNGIGNADVLIPLTETQNNLLFGQLGVRYNGERTTNNIGLGARTFTDNWMFGVNTFYDYDLTGKNSRLGVGGEAWTDNLKFSANGYFRLTDWHQSVLADMEDYDERPANGFDVRAEAYLPSHPQLGGRLMYEKYFGKGVALNSGSTSPSDLGDSPSAFTVGVNYTPIPLFTIDMAHKKGQNTNNELQLGLNFNYRFGVPWVDQINRNAVGLMRSLMGSRYDIVDRNYNIVMQYQKQDLIRLTLPETLSAYAISNLQLTGNINSKYGAERVEWSAPALIAAGGALVPLTLESASVTFPPYQQVATANSYQVSAVAYDVRGNRSNTATTTLVVQESPQQISLALNGGSHIAIADGTTLVSYIATVVDTSGPVASPLAGMNIAFNSTVGDVTIPNAVTDNQGKANIAIKSSLAGSGHIRGVLDNGNRAQSPLTFIADSGTAEIANGNLTVTVNNAIANGLDRNAVQVLVTDANGNPVPDEIVNFSVDSGSLANASASTAVDGIARMELTNLVAGTSVVTATVNGSSASENTTFRPDLTTAEIADADFTVGSGAVANNIATNAVSATVKDAGGNVVPNADVTFTVTGGATFVGTTQNTKVASTDNSGVATAALISRVTGDHAVTATVGTNTTTAKNSNFVADETTAIIAGADFTVDSGAVANNIATNAISATVKDGNGNLVPNVSVTFEVTGGATFVGTTQTTNSVMTDGSGVATAALISQVAGDHAVTATVGTNTTAAKNTTFVADETTAEIGSTDFTVASGAVANNTDTNAVSATVKDGNGNLVPNVSVTFEVTGGATFDGGTGVSKSAITNSSGVAIAQLFSRVAGDHGVTATVGSNTTATKTSTFTPDEASAIIASADFTVASGAIANNIATNAVSATVKDSNGNIVPNVSVTFAVSGGATFEGGTELSKEVITNNLGVATAALISRVAGDHGVTVTVGTNTTAAKTSTFIADETTAEVGSTDFAVASGAIANNAATNAVSATVKDAEGNLVPNVNVTFAVSGGATFDGVTEISKSATTNNAGVATATLVSLVAGDHGVTATVGTNTTASKTSTFIADETTAEISSADFTVASGAVANNTETNAVSATVKDSNGNTVPNAVVTFAVTGGATFNGGTEVSEEAITNGAGVATAALISRVAGDHAVTATVGTSTTTAKTSTFIADETTAEIGSTDFTVASGAVANNTETNAVSATVKDGNGNIVPNVSVTFVVSGGATFEGGTELTKEVNTNSAGVATALLISRVAGDHAVTATVGIHTTAAKTSTFVADETTAIIASTDFTVASGAVANNMASNAVSAIVKDADGNLVPNVTVTFAVTGGATFDGAAEVNKSVMTNNSGVATAALVSLMAGDHAVTATVGTNTTAAKTSTFIADETSAIIASADFTVASGAVANNIATNEVSATVKDGNGNTVPNVSVTFTVSGGATFEGGADLSKEVITNNLGVATALLISRVAGDHDVTATVGTNTTTAKTSTFIADETTAIIGSTDFTVASGAVANNTETNAVSATVKDGNGNLVPNVNVTFVVSGGATFDGATEVSKSATTNNAGVATATLVSLVAGDHGVTATVGTNTTAAKTSNFIADETTAVIGSTDFTVANGAVANNTATNAISATVKDGNGNTVPNVVVTFAVTGGATFNGGIEVTKEAITNNDGVATAALISLVAGDHAVTATVGTNTTAAKTSNFIADETTAEIGSTDFTVASGAAANNTATNAVSATVKDGNGNLVPNVSVTFVVSGGATFEGGADLSKEVITNNLGVATALLISRVAGDHDVTATVGTNTTTAKTSTFIADETTAIIGSTDFTVASGAVANNIATNAVSATVKDADGNLVPNVTVTFAVTGGATFDGTTEISKSAITNNAGVATATLVSLVAGDHGVTATVATNTTTAKNSTFIADETTAIIGSTDFTVASGAAANNTATNAVSATVKDGNGNLVPNVSVTFVVSGGATFEGGTELTKEVNTNSAGVATALLISRVAGGHDVTATVGTNTTAAKASTFIADETTAIIGSTDFTVASGAVANNTATNAISATVKDGNGNLVPNVGVTFVVSGGATFANTAQQTTLIVNTNNDGVATAALVSLIAGDHGVTAKVGTNTTAAKTSNFIAGDISGAKSTFAIDKNIISANGSASLTMTFTARDEHNNLVRGADVKFKVEGISSGITLGPISESQGVYTATLTSTQKGLGNIATYIDDTVLEDMATLSFGVYRSSLEIKVN